MQRPDDWARIEEEALAAACTAQTNMDATAGKTSPNKVVEAPSSAFNTSPKKELKPTQVS